jgi:hypothetical protein
MPELPKNSGFIEASEDVMIVSLVVFITTINAVGMTRHFRRHKTNL